MVPNCPSHHHQSESSYDFHVTASLDRSAVILIDDQALPQQNVSFSKDMIENAIKALHQHPAHGYLCITGGARDCCCLLSQGHRAPF